MHKKCCHPLVILLLVLLVVADNGHTADQASGSRIQIQDDEGIALILHWSSPVEVKHVLKGRELILVFNQPIEKEMLRVLSAVTLSAFIDSQQTGYDSIRLNLAEGVAAEIHRFEYEVRVKLHSQHGGSTTAAKDQGQDMAHDRQRVRSDILVTLESGSLSEETKNEFILELLEGGANKQALQHHMAHDRQRGHSDILEALGGGRLSEETENELIFELLEGGAYIQALPHLRTRAINYGGDWLYTYADAAKNAKQSVRLAELLIAEIQREDLSQPQIEERVWVLIEELPITAIIVLSEKARRDPQNWLNYYAYALKQDKDGNKRLIEFIETTLARSDLSDNERGVLLSELIEAGGQQQARAYLRRLTLSGDPRWVTFYREQLEAMHQDQELRELLFLRGRDPAVSLVERREIASTLLSLGNKSAALQVLLALAENAPADSPDVEELLFLWGPRPAAAELEWLTKRATGETAAAQQAAWLRHLIRAGGASRAVELIETQLGTKEPELRAVRVIALNELGHDKALQEAVRSAIAVESDLERLVYYAQISQERNYPEIARSAWQRVLEKDPAHTQALHQLGIMAFEQGRLKVAQTYLTAYLDKANADFEANFTLAETLRLRKRRVEAALLYGRVLEQIRAAKISTIHTGLTEARVLSRLGKAQASETKFRRMLQESPADRVEILTAYVQTLIDNRRYKEALDVLDIE